MRNPQFYVSDKRPIVLLLQSGLVITRSNMIRCCISLNKDKGKTKIMLRTHKMHPIARPWGPSYGVFIKNVLDMYVVYIESNIDRVLTEP